MATQKRKPAPQPAPAPSTGPVLNLRTFTDRLTIAIDGVSYPFLRMDELSIIDYHYTRNGGKRLFELWGRTDLTPEEGVEYVDTVRRMSRAIVHAPEAVMAALTDRQQMQICERFILLPLAAQPAGAVAPAGTSPTASSIGGN